MASFARVMEACDCVPSAETVPACDCDCVLPAEEFPHWMLPPVVSMFKPAPPRTACSLAAFVVPYDVGPAYGVGASAPLPWADVPMSPRVPIDSIALEKQCAVEFDHPSRSVAALRLAGVLDTARSRFDAPGRS